MLSDLKVVATITAKPESVDVVRAGLAELAAESLHEDGNVSYELFESAAERGTFVTIEVWRSEDDLDAHMKTPHLQKALSEFGEHLAAPPAIHPLRVVR
ncbi:antibiotic biosynthesis monooxygenase [Rhodococcus sp. RS1C4]|uniref:putative quinol monooxygenase n=1 Tax=Nocardiaceae TaxID=85025 RepID=UPI00036DFBA3|nr:MULTISPECIES: putative quinol monooxygenase [Rhodococcus]OZC54455.1 antibiotic biosynthesis monooxygenase [Rhodococcus sp. RS1C4]OZC75592.1 antibiotic biosynthesis monooxygenase [Rhodococcus sp. 06-418-1B]OZD12242.1 antibiotic biosynthesis monooxygenase [Rhodococcus sp. 06-156-3C]OZD19091.1 antibiotic biosynthesis monooxygenase [Rhodococcus sp. 06-156-4C]OZD20868.1 antibiotic biosynthesis monooxygenase [Rhodococcus sp. 06-156-4a]